jgi:hypothetical protein
MALNFIIGSGAQDALANAMDDEINANTPPADLTIYSDAVAQPAGPGTATASVALATITFETVAFGAASAGVISGASLPKQDTSITGGTADWFRIAQGGQTPATAGTADGSVGTATFDLVVNTVTFGGGDTFQLDTFTITMPVS